MKKNKIHGLGIMLLCSTLLAGCGQSTELQHFESLQGADAARQEGVNQTGEANHTEKMTQAEDKQQIKVAGSQDVSSDEPYIFDFRGLNAPSEAPKWGNHIMNLKQSISGLVCPDEENGVTYYVNCGRDDYLYRLQDGESTLVLDRVVSSLNIWDGELYFVLHEDGDIRGMGNICKWNPETNAQETVIEGPVRYFRMNGSGIYFVEGQLQEFEGGYMISSLPRYYSFEEEQLTEHSYGDWDAYGDYVMQSLVTDNELVGVGLCNPDTKEVIPVYPKTNSRFLINQCIFEDCYYGVRDDEEQLTWINLQDGTACQVGIDGIDATWVKFKDYTELDGEIYLSLESEMLARLDKESQSLEPIHVQTENNQLLSLEEVEAGLHEEKIHYTYHELYTDGEALYALKHYIIDSEQALYDGLLLVQLKPQGDSFVEVALGDGNDE